MDKKDYEAMDKKELIEIIEDLEAEAESRGERIGELIEKIEKLRDEVDESLDAIELLEEQVDGLKDRLRKNGIVTDSRNFTIDNLYYLLCGRYGVSYHTSKDKLKELVDEELSL